MRIPLVAAFLALGCLAGPTMADIYYVDGAVGDDGALGSSWSAALRTVTNALNKANGGDQIWVAAGVYSPGPAQADSFNMKSNVSLYGGFTNGGGMGDRNWTNNATVFDGSNVNYHIVKAVSISPFILDGFIVKRGHCNGSSDRYGGGVYISGGRPLIYNCTFASNTSDYASGCGGAAIYAEGVTDPNAIVSNCVFVGNTQLNIGNSGGAAVSMWCSLNLTKCVFRSNSGGSGGAFFVGNGSPILRECTFVQNASGSGQYGGAFLGGWSSGARLYNCTFISNSAASGYGSAIGLYANSTAGVVNCSFSANSGSAALRIVYYSAGNQYSVAYVTNCIFWGDSSEITVEANGPTATVSYCDISGGWSGGGVSNINANPLYASGTDLRLQSRGGRWTSAGWISDPANSPCIDAGDGSPYGNEPQPNGGRINMGAYGNTVQASKTATLPVSVSSQGIFIDKVKIAWIADAAATGYRLFKNTSNNYDTASEIWSGSATNYEDTASISGAPVYYWVLATNAGGTCNMGFDMRAIICVRTDGSDASDGYTWPNALRTVTSALARVTVDAAQIWVAAGTYSPGVNQADTIAMKSYVGLYGGFTNGCSFNDRNRTNNPTILDGSNVNYHVVKHVNANNVVIDGFTIQRGNGSTATECMGGGLYISGGFIAINNCLIVSNVAWQTGANNGYGGGMYVTGVIDSNAVVSNCVFLANASGNNPAYGNCGGGGVFIDNSPYPTFKYCVFRLNGGSYGGGAFANNNGSICQFQNCDFIGNFTLYGYGGGFVWGWGSRARLINCTFVTNWSAYSGGAMMSYYSTGVVINCSTYGNYAATHGGAISVEYSAITRSYIHFTNCVFWGDSPGEIYIDNSSLSTVTGNYSDVQGGWAGISNIDANPLFASVTDLHVKSKNGRWSAGTWVYDASNSPCIDAGDPSMGYALEPNGNGGRINMGAYGNTVQASRSTPGGTFFIFQ